MDWTSCDIFIPEDANLGSTNLIFGMYGDRYDNRLSYQNYNNYSNNWIGQVPGEFNAIYPKADSGRAKQYGLHNVPVTYDKTNIWCLDGDGDRYLRILQGVSIIDGVVYSNRQTIIGGGIIAENNVNITTDKINSGLTGYVRESISDSNNCANYVNSAVMYDQVFKGVDFVFKGNSNTITRSEIRRPNTWQDRSGDKITDQAKNFNPKLLITGGSMYVGAKQTLTIQGTVNSTTTFTNATGNVPSSGQSLNNMMVSPTSITVAKGGKLVIQSSSSFNVATDIYVSGELVIESGAKVRGNIIVETGGVASIKSGAAFEGNIFIEGGDDENPQGGVFTIGQSSKVTGDTWVYEGGTLNIESSCTITGDVHVLGTLNTPLGFTLNFSTAGRADGGDNPATGNIDESKDENKIASGSYPYHGIFIYSTQADGTGTLNLTKPVVAGGIIGNSGKIHTFAGHKDDAAGADNTYCSDRIKDATKPDVNACQHWTSSDDVWLKQGDSVGGTSG
jgi:hypothetical protein